MTDKVHQGYANAAEERQRKTANEGGHASHEKGAAHEFDNRSPADASRRDAGSDTTAGDASNAAKESNEFGESKGTSAQPRGRRTRGGTHDQHVTAGKKGGSRIRELIELGYKYEKEHGIGPGRNERSKLAAKRRSSKAGGDEPGE
jgi:uncharacterized protein